MYFPFHILQHDVSELEKKLKTTNMSPSEQSTVYLVLDTPALCRHLSLLRALVKSANFVVIIPTQGTYTVWRLQNDTVSLSVLKVGTH